MLFNSLQYLVYLPLVAALYFLFPHRYRWILLLTASLYFYACWKVEYLALILFSIVIDYIAGLMIERAVTPGRRRLFLTVSLTSNLGLLFAFKYANFFGDNMRLLFQQFNLLHEIPHFDVLLPIGISFYTFQTMSYAIDVYQGKRKAERHFGMFALYVSFFPQLVAGPIERSTRLLPQLYKLQDFDWMKQMAVQLQIPIPKNKDSGDWYL